MIKTKQVFFWTSNLKGYGFHGDKATILYLTLKYYSLSVLSEKTLFYWNRSSKSKVMVIWMYNAENF